MRQQLFLFVVLAAIIVGIVMAIGIKMYNNASAATANLEAVTSDLLYLGTRAQQYYVKPSGMGGGGNKFTGVTISDLTAKATSYNGTYSIIGTTDAFMAIKGIGKQDGDHDGINCIVVVTVFPDSIEPTIINY